MLQYCLCLETFISVTFFQLSEDTLGFCIQRLRTETSFQLVDDLKRSACHHQTFHSNELIMSTFEVSNVTWLITVAWISSSETSVNVDHIIDNTCVFIHVMLYRFTFARLSGELVVGGNSYGYFAWVLLDVIILTDSVILYHVVCGIRYLNSIYIILILYCIQCQCLFCIVT